LSIFSIVIWFLVVSTFKCLSLTLCREKRRCKEGFLGCLQAALSYKVSAKVGKINETDNKMKEKMRPEDAFCCFLVAISVLMRRKERLFPAYCYFLLRGVTVFLPVVVAPFFVAGSSFFAGSSMPSSSRVKMSVANGLMF
jgi:hypothetical protein